MMDKRFTALSAAFCLCLIASNIFEAKIFTLGALTLTGGFLIFPVSYIINDILSEIYGYRNTRFIILLAFALNALFILATQLVRMLPAADYCNAQEHFDYFFRTDLRISTASMAAFVCGSLINARVMAFMKGKQGEKGFGWRAVSSSLAGETVDSVIFFPIAFFGLELRQILTLMVTQILLKTAYEVIVLPLTYAVIRHFKSASS